MRHKPKNVGVLILAAGAATRFGSPKALAGWREGTLLSNALAKAEALAAPQVVVVLGAHVDQLKPLLPDTFCAFNPHWASGMGTSIARGSECMLEHFPATDVILVLPVDQPLVTEDHLATLVTKAQDQDCCALSQDDMTLGPPAAIPRRFFPLALKLDGKRGMKSILDAGEFVCIPAEPGSLVDIDTPDDLARVAAL